MRIKKLYIEGMEHHTSFRENTHELKCLVRTYLQAADDVASVEGMEDWKESLAALKDVTFPLAKKAAGSAWNVTKFISKEGMKIVGKAVDTSSLQIKKLSENNKHFIKEIINQLPDKAEFEITFTNLPAITTDGKIDDFIHDINGYKDVVNAMNKHSNDLLDYLNSNLQLLSKVNKDSTVKDVMSLLMRADDIHYPKLKLDDHLLPGGRTIKHTVKEDDVKYSMSTDKPSGTSETIRYSREEVKSVLNKLIELNETLLLVKKGQEQFMATMKTWNDKLPTIMSAMVENTTMSTAAKDEVKYKLKFNSAILSFYGELYPELGACVNSYIISLTGNFAKTI